MVKMCRRVTCLQCGKPTYAGCSQHVEQVLADVPKAQRCDCTPTAEARSKGGFLRKLLGRA
ncbi:hypothetical protein EIL87_21610 [Saccharopolyspora rhizosphaerae]|uniref:Uncharacterized protein n=1 Tax=Saccharopolyspora rhizosphaerae TaxID=2492662 RepID=A0A426JL72_9PSEU|nr:hypothetical protein EIL87_21610 [Saccharopolyspora rhizosphaerae]